MTTFPSPNGFASWYLEQSLLQIQRHHAPNLGLRIRGSEHLLPRSSRVWSGSVRWGCRWASAQGRSRATQQRQELFVEALCRQHPPVQSSGLGMLEGDFKWLGRIQATFQVHIVHGGESLLMQDDSIPVAAVHWVNLGWVLYCNLLLRMNQDRHNIDTTEQAVKYTISCWWFWTFFIFPLILGMSSSQLTNSYFSEGIKTPTRKIMANNVAKNSGKHT